MRINNPPLILDNTVIARFAGTNQFNLLCQLYSKRIIIPSNVIAEAVIVPGTEQILQSAIQDNHIEIYTLDYISGATEFKEYAQLRRRFGEGESAAMAIAKTWNCTLGSDDLSATLKYSRNHGIQLIGSLGILYDAFESNLLNYGQAAQLLVDMITVTGYRCPVNNFQQVVDWFTNGIGRELF